MMFKTTILLPSELKREAEERARKLGVSLGQFIREALKGAMLSRVEQKKQKLIDPFYVDKIIYEGTTPSDIAMNHDEYLYGDKE